MGKTEYLYVGDHAETLESGRPIASGETVELTDEEAKAPHNADLIENSKLLTQAKVGKKEGGDK